MIFGLLFLVLLIMLITILSSKKNGIDVTGLKIGFRIILIIILVYFGIFIISLFGRKTETKNINLETIQINPKNISFCLNVTGERNQFTNYRYKVADNELNLTIYSRLFNSKEMSNPCLKIKIEDPTLINRVIVKGPNKNDIKVLWTKE